VRERPGRGGGRRELGGQAALFLADHAREVQLVVREHSLDEFMSRYLADRILHDPRIEVHLHTEVRELVGEHGQLEAVVVQDTEDGSRSTLPARELMVFIGADPCTGWLAGTVALDSGATCAPARTRPRPPGVTTPIGNRGGRPRCWRRTSRACSRQATCAADRSSGWRPRSAKERWRSAWCTSTWRTSDTRRCGMAGPSSVPVFERFFRSVAQLKVDKSDVKRFREFVDEMVDGIAIAGRNSARWNDRDVIAPMDLPITKGLRSGCASSTSWTRRPTSAPCWPRPCADRLPT
jgi:hypothetical protein